MSEHKPLVLYVDDDSDCRQIMRLMLKNTDYELVIAASGEEAIAACRQKAPDLAIVDLMMEEVDSGLVFVKELRLMGIQAPIYMLTSVGDSLDLSTDQQTLGLAGIFQKPLDAATLLSILKSRLGR